jgi:hypothetical protein
MDSCSFGDAFFVASILEAVFGIAQIFWLLKLSSQDGSLWLGVKKFFTATSLATIIAITLIILLHAFDRACFNVGVGHQVLMVVIYIINALIVAMYTYYLYIRSKGILMKRPALGNFMQIFVPAVIIVVLVGHLALIAFEIQPVGVVPPSVTRLIMAIFLVAADIIYTVEFMRYANTAKKIFSLSKDETTWTKLEIIAYFGMLSVVWAFLAAVAVFLNSYLTSTLARDLTHVAYTLMLLMLSLSLLFLKFQMKKYGHEDEFATINRRKQSHASSKTRNTDMFYNKSKATSESVTEEPTIV